tara:strand:+ start:1842 stop:2564 length:723 start_codon:yes stop_codon:yes gene_type:complete
MSYKIIPSTRKLHFKENDIIPDHMPQLPMRGLFIAASGSGKTECVANMLKNEAFGYKQAFRSNIFLFSSTASLSDPAWDGVNIREENVFNTYRADIINEIVADNEVIIKKNDGKKTKCPHVLILIDDLVCDIPTSKQSELINLYLSSRHRCISVMILSQVFRSCIPKGIRLNCSFFCIWAVNDMEANSIAEEQGQIKKNDFLNILEEATKERYDFLFINLSKPVPERFYRNFEELLEIVE